MTTKYNWIVSGKRTMRCTGCVKSVEYALSRLPGVQLVKADFRSQRIEAEISDSTILNQIMSELDMLGYVVNEIANDTHD